MKRYYQELPQKIIKNAGSFKHLMALTLNPLTDHRDGVIRCIVDRKGSVHESGFIDKSQLFKIQADSLTSFHVTEALKIKNQNKVINNLKKDKHDELLGLEDADIWIDEKKNIHLYFTMPFKKIAGNFIAHLGHAQGKNLNSLIMTEPVLIAKNTYFNAKEISIAPKNKKGLRYNLFESADLINGVYYSVVKIAIAKDMGKPWKYGRIVFHPAKNKIKWAGEHASPGPFFPKSFIDPGVNKIVGILNGREKSNITKTKIKYNMFSIGLFVYDYEKGKIDWTSKRPLIIDSKAKSVTFASQFVECGPGEGLLYAHVDDSFVRAYRLSSHEINKLLYK